MKKHTGLVDVVLAEGPYRIHNLLEYCDSETGAWDERFPSIPALWNTDYRDELEGKFRKLRLGESVVFTTAIPSVAQAIGDFLDSIGFQVELR